MSAGNSLGALLARRRALVMGVLNVTPDSFSDGGRYLQKAAAVEQAMRMADEGAAIIDVGGESTRPGASPVPAAEQCARIVPVIEAIRARSAVLLSVDTSEPAVMQAAVRAGADIINDVRALSVPGALEAAASARVSVCLMHMQGTPATMQLAPAYEDVVQEVFDFLERRIADCVAAGIARDRLILDPGFGFGKSLEHNIALLRNLGRFAATGLPVLAGLSRKAMIGALTGRTTGDRLAGSVALAVMARERGASILRVHDVGPSADALRLADAILGHGTGGDDG
jgi:dihydropteroate synthase